MRFFEYIAMNMYKRYFILLFVACMGIVSCQKSVKISGTVSGQADKTVYLRQLSAPNIIDSAKLSSSGDFSLVYKFKNTDPQFLTLQLNNEKITLLAEEGENIKISAFMSFDNGYQIEGSEGSMLLQQLQQSMNDTYRSIDSLYLLYGKETDVVLRDSLLKDITRAYVKQKQNTIKFIVLHANSLAAITALYQRMPNGMGMFEELNDVAYFKMVADSLNNKYPNSVYVKSLNKDVEQQNRQKKVVNMLFSAREDGNIHPFPDIIMQDMMSQTHKLSDLKGNVVILSFWSSTANTENNMLNRELRDIYNIYNKKGLEIYQVGLDESKIDWVNAVNTQKLPWISVCDFQGYDSPAVKNYNVTSVPFNYIIDREGNIKGKNIWGNDLIKKIEDLL